MAFSVQHHSSPEDFLLTCESPFTWRLPQIPRDVDQYLCTQLEKCTNTEEEHEFKWIKFGLDLWLGFELWRQQGDIVSATYYVNRCYHQLEQLTDSHCSEQLFSSIQGALWHITLATKAHLLLASRLYNDAFQIISNIQPIYSLSRSERAGLFGIKAAFCRQYKPMGHTLVLKFATQAKELDPHQAEWHFLIANSLGRIRRLERGLISTREITEMEQAFILKKDATYTGHLGQLLAERATYMYHNRYNQTVSLSPHQWLTTSMNYARTAVERFKEAHLLRPHDPQMKIRLAHGLLRLPRRFISEGDVAFAKQLLEEARIHAPANSMLFHDLGRYYYIFAGDPDRAVEHLEKAHTLGNYPAFIYLIILRWKHRSHDCLVQALLEAMEKYTTDSNKAELLVYLGTVHLLLKENWTKAVLCFIKSFHKDPHGKYIKAFTGFCGNPTKTSFVEIITNELRSRIVNDNKNQTLFTVFLYKVLLMDPNLIKKPLVPNLFFQFKEAQRQFGTQLNSQEF